MKSGKLIDLDTKKKILVDMLKDIVNFCEKNNINYFLSEGTMLGAVRHKGFIPWDDDIDLMFYKDDYKRLLNEYKSDKYKLLSFENTDDYFYSFAKIVDTRTKLNEFSVRNIKELGVYIDLFPLDYFTENKLKSKIKLFKLNMYNKICFYYRVNKDTLIKRHIYNLKNKILFKLFHNNKKLNNKCLYKINNIGENKKTNLIINIGGAYGKKGINECYIDDYIYMDFEGIKCRIPKKYDIYLRDRYGNYMELPPEEKRISRHEDDSFWR